MRLADSLSLCTPQLLTASNALPVSPFPAVLFHMTEACAIYFLGLPVTWGATAKVSTGI